MAQPIFRESFVGLVVIMLLTGRVLTVRLLTVRALTVRVSLLQPHRCAGKLGHPWWLEIVCNRVKAFSCLGGLKQKL
jgi:hypothetical protein